MSDGPVPSPPPPTTPPTTTASPDKHSIWMRGLMMILMIMAFQLTSSLLGLVAVMQFVLMLVTDKFNDRLAHFSRSMGQYLRQIAEFLGFATERIPFPFSDWPKLN